MNLEMFSNLLSQRHGIDQSIAGSVINAIISHLTQQQGGDSISNLFSQGNNYSDESRMGAIQSVLSNLIGQKDRGKLNTDHSLVQYVQQKTGIQDPDQARDYVHKALDLMNEHANSNSQGLHSLFRNLIEI